MEPKQWGPRRMTAYDIARDMIEDLHAVASSLLDTVRQGEEPDFTDLDVEILKLKKFVLEAWQEER